MSCTLNNEEIKCLNVQITESLRKNIQDKKIADLKIIQHNRKSTVK